MASLLVEKDLHLVAEIKPFMGAVELDGVILERLNVRRHHVVLHVKNDVRVFTDPENEHIVWIKAKV